MDVYEINMKYTIYRFMCAFTIATVGLILLLVTAIYRINNMYIYYTIMITSVILLLFGIILIVNMIRRNSSGNSYNIETI